MAESEHPPLPLRSLNEVTGWIVHTLNVETTKKLPLNVDTKRSILEKISELQNLVANIGSSYTVLQARLDEARLVPPTLVKRFAQTLAERDSSFDVRLADYVNTHLLLPPPLETPTADNANPKAPSYADKASSRASRLTVKTTNDASLPHSKSKATARSRSRVKKGLEKLASSRVIPTAPAFILESSSGKTASEAQAELWTEVCKITRTPKVTTIKARNGNLVLKPQDRETADILKGLARAKSHSLREDVPRRPRVKIDNISRLYLAQ